MFNISENPSFILTIFAFYATIFVRFLIFIVIPMRRWMTLGFKIRLLHNEKYNLVIEVMKWVVTSHTVDKTNSIYSHNIYLCEERAEKPHAGSEDEIFDDTCKNNRNQEMQIAAK